MRTILICGSRSWEDWGAIYRALAEFDEPLRVVDGVAPAPRNFRFQSADNIARRIVESLHEFDPRWKLIPRPAKWRQFGVRAGFVRNQEMLNEKPEAVLAFWDGESRGTKDMIERADRASIPIRLYSSQPARRSVPSELP